MNRDRFAVLLLIILVVLLVVSACGPSAPAATLSAPVIPTATTKPVEAPPTSTPVPMPTQAPALAQTSPPDGLPPEPRLVTFTAQDGQALQGLYYPAAVQSAPLVVLLHWAPGDQNDWPEIAFWLQNRGQGGKTPNPKKYAWLDPSWFPPMLQGQSFAVFTFNSRGCAGGCKTFNRAGWLLDAQAAMQTASELEGIDPQRIVTLGASIGADGAADGCAWLNAQSGKSRCLGALSLSPGNYLTLPYADAVKSLGAEQPAKPAWCLYAEKDAESVTACTSASGANYRVVSYPGTPHGLMLVDPTVEPSVMQLILDWLKLSLGL
jgi:hypothetical protein